MNNKNKIEEVLEGFGRQTPEPEKAFARQFLRHYPAIEEDEDSAAQRAGMTTGFFDFLRQRRPGELLMRVYNPTEETSGWSSTHTVVEMVNDDMPFLVDSVVLALSRLDIGVHLIIHPVVRLKRDQGGHFLEMAADDDSERAAAESLIHIRIDRQTSPDALARIERRIRSALADVRVAVSDWKEMTRKTLEIADELAESNSGLDADELAEAREFFKWLADDHFTLLGYREYLITERDDGRVLKPVDESGLGLMRDSHRKSPSRLLSDLSGDPRGTSGEIHPDHHYQDQRPGDRSPRRLHGLHLGAQVRRFRTGERRESASSDCSPPAHTSGAVTIRRWFASR